jgi:ABC-2 type transport system permease protein
VNEIERTVPSLRRVLTAFSAMGRQSAARERGVAVGLFAMPVLVMLVVGLALRGYSTPSLMIGALEAESRDAKRLVAMLQEDPHVSLRAHSDRERMRVAVYRGRLHGGMIFPTDWTADMELPLYASKAGAGTPVMRAILDRAIAKLQAPDVLTGEIDVVDGDALGNPPVGYQYTAPSNLVLFVMINGIVGAAGIVGLRRTGLGKRLLAAPVTPTQLFLSFGLVPLQLMATQAVFLIVVGALVFDVDWGSPVGLVVLTSSLILAGASMSVLLGTLFHSENQATSFGPFLGIMLGMLGGCMWPLEIVPGWVQTLGHFFPTAWAMDGYLALIFGGVESTVILPSAAALVGMAAVFSTLAVFRLRRQLSGA